MGPHQGKGIWSTRVCILKAIGTDLSSQNGDISQKPYLSAVMFSAAELTPGQTTKMGRESATSIIWIVSYQGHPAELESDSSSVVPEPAFLTN